MTADIIYVDTARVSPEELAALFRASGIRRPADDLPRLERMIRNANLIIGAYCEGRLVGVARALTDFSYCCYLSDLAVARPHQGRGVGRELLRRVQARIGEESMLLLLSAPEAMAFYPKAGFEAAHNGWMVARRR
jgi:GNAT superfamily N-acetyltransferase